MQVERVERECRASMPRAGFGSELSLKKADTRDIINTLRHAGNEERSELWQELMGHREKHDVFTTLLISKSTQKSRTLKMEALLVMQLMGDDGVKVMKDAFRRSDSWTRAQLIGVFSTLRSDDAFPELAQAIDDRNISTEKRLLALEAISRCSEKQQDKLVRLLNSRDPSVRSRIARIIGNRKFELGRQRLKRMLLEEKDLGVLYSIIEALNEMGESITIEEVMNLRDGSEKDKRSIIRGMREIASKYGQRVYATVSALITALLSLGHTLSSVSSLISMIIKNPSQNVPRQVREGANEDL